MKGSPTDSNLCHGPSLCACTQVISPCKEVLALVIYSSELVETMSAKQNISMLSFSAVYSNMNMFVSVAGITCLVMACAIVFLLSYEYIFRDASNNTTCMVINLKLIAFSCWADF